MSSSTFRARRISFCAPRLARLVLAILPAAAAFGLQYEALAQCSASGALPVGAVVTCSGTQSTIVGQGPGADNVIVTVNDGASVAVTDTNAISLGNNATITLGSSGPNPPVLVETTTDGAAGNGQYGDGSNTIDIGSNSTIVINSNASVIAAGTQSTSEAINPYGSGDTITNYGVIQGGPSTAIWFQNVAPSRSPANVVENYGTIIAGTSGQAIGASGNVGIDFTNETGGTVIGSVDLSGGDDHVTLNPGSTITGNLDGGGGDNLLTLNASPGSSDTMSGQINNFETLDKTGAGVWTLTGAIGNNTAAGSTPLIVNVIGGTLVLTGDNTAFNGVITINPGVNPAKPGPDPSATLEAPAQSLPPTITDHGILLINQSTPGTYGGLVQGTGVLTKIGGGVLTLTGANTYSGGTFLNAGAVAVSADSALGAATGPLTFNGGVLQFDSNFNLSSSRVITLNAAGGGFAGGGGFDVNGHATTVSQGIVGAGGLTISDSSGGGGVLVLTGANSYTGGTTIAGGALQLGAGGISGSVVGNVTDNGALVFDRSDVVTFPGIISGTGSLAQIGSGVVILDAANPFSGPTTVVAGALAIGDALDPAAALSGGGAVTVDAGASLGGYGSVSGDVVNNGTVAVGNALAPFAGGPTGDFRIGGNLVNDGTLDLAGSTIGNVLEVAKNYTAGAGGATLNLNTFLNSGGPLSNQTTDRLLIEGNAAGQTTVHVNASGPGAYTSVDVVHAGEGISLIQVAGASSANAFSLQGGYVTGGTPFQYHLNAFGPGSPNGPATASQSLVGNAGGYWDYRLQSVYVTPDGPVAPEPDPTPPAPNERLEVAPQVPAYLATPNALFNAGLMDLDNLHRRLGEIRDNQIAGTGEQYELFARGYGGSLAYTSNRSFADFGFNATEDYAAMQFGANWIARDDANGTLRLGAAAAIGRLWFQPSAVDGSSQGMFNTQDLFATMTWISRSTGWYVDAVLMGGAFDGSISTSARGKTTGLEGSSFAASIESGYPIPLGWYGLTIEPQAQLVVQHLNFAKRTDVDGINVDLGDPNQGVLRAGARLMKSFLSPGGAAVTSYVKASVLQGLGGGDPANFGAVALPTGRFGTALQEVIGVSSLFSKTTTLYGEAGLQQNMGGSGSRGWALNVGLRSAF